MASRVVPLYADWRGRLIGAIRGTARKCLVLDLENTVWGGVIGDEGLEGIRIGQGSAEGEAFLDFSMLNALVGAATSHNVSYIAAIYPPTAKNSMVAGHYDSRGFIRTSVGEESAVRYRLSLSDYIAPILPFRISE
jgi:predicted enzyme involved in methoxymalonyl-ACP biosynthesis